MTEPGDNWGAWDRQHCWHPFTQHAGWASEGEELILVRGEGPWLFDAEGRRYFDGNSSIWTNIHGHRHPRIDAALRMQLDEVAHTSFLGFGNPRAAELAKRLTAFFPSGSLERVFFSDDGSTAVEVAVKMAIQFRQQSGEPERVGFIAFENAYHGDTMGAASLGGVSFFFDRFRSFGFRATRVTSLADLRALPAEEVARAAAIVLEPLIQGVNEMRPWPAGQLAEIRSWCDGHGVHLILDEVMTGFGRTGTMFACQQEEVIPDFLCLAKGLTGGYLPLAATLTTGRVFDAFLGGRERTLNYGHSYTANQLGCAAALASLRVFEEDRVLEKLPARVEALAQGLRAITHSSVHEVRQCGLIAGLELRQESGKRFSAGERMGERVCSAARAHGLLTRPIKDTIVMMPPLCSTEAEIAEACAALGRAVKEVG
ncbi:MAG: adenosylmethionine--8-amino-7-oxononanoate transaminase [Roseibacillus sp.]|nr:adenosylmethionine--8-amino-7-oxononanoate transaminase [Roseibacillus sp.]HAO94448.1 adenosylmethionine--8-amino-7-oxononanoate transaminase [Verrucomicrobiales bacterium]